MQLVLDDGAAQGRPEFLVARLGLLARGELPGRISAQAVVGVGAESLAVEFIGAGLGFRGDRRARDLVEFRLVVRRDDLVLTDGELREWVALGKAIAVDAAKNVVLLADAVDIDVCRTLIVRATANRRVALLIDAERHTGDGIREFQKVAGELWHRLDLLQ